MTSNISNQVVEALARHYEMVKSIDDGPLSQLELGEKTDVSHSTAHRRVNKFRDLGLVKCDNEQVKLTDLGQQLLERHQSYLNDVDRLSRLDAARKQLDTDLSLDSSILDGAVVEHDDNFAIDSAGYSNRERFEDAIRVVGVFDGFMGPYFEVHRNNPKFESLDIVVPGRRADVLAETYPDLINDLLEQDVLTVHETDQPIPYSSTVVQTETRTFAVLLTHEAGGSTCHVFNDSDAAIEWAKDRNRRYRDNATPVDISESY